MKILLVTPFLPSPPRFGGQRRLDGIARQLATRHELSVLSLNRPDPWTELSIDATRAYCHEVVTLPEQDFEESDKRPLQLRSLFSPRSFEHLVKVKRRDFQAKLDAMLAANRYDLVQVEFAQMTAFEFPQAAGGPRYVLDEHNIEYDLVRRTAKAAQGLPRQLYNALNWRKLAREERAAWLRFDGIVLTSARDKEFVLDAVPKAKATVAPNGVDVEAFAPSAEPVEPDTLLFFGAIKYFPNTDGVVYFIEQILPRLRARRPNVRFQILGPGSEAMDDRRGNGVEVLGMVDDVGPYIDRAAVVVVPLRIGGGTRLKIVEALAKGKAIVSTSLGAEGIDVRHEEHLLLADDPERFAAEVERVLADRELASRLGRAGRALAEARYSWRTVVGGLEEFYEELVTSARARRSA